MGYRYLGLHLVSDLACISVADSPAMTRFTNNVLDSAVTKSVGLYKADDLPVRRVPQSLAIRLHVCQSLRQGYRLYEGKHSGLNLVQVGGDVHGVLVRWAHLHEFVHPC